MHARRTVFAVLFAAVLIAVLLHPGLVAAPLFLPVVLFALLAPALWNETHRDGPWALPTSIARPAAPGRAPPFPSRAA